MRHATNWKEPCRFQYALIWRTKRNSLPLTQTLCWRTLFQTQSEPNVTANGRRKALWKIQCRLDFPQGTRFNEIRRNSLLPPARHHRYIIIIAFNKMIVKIRFLAIKPYFSSFYQTEPQVKEMTSDGGWFTYRCYNQGNAFTHKTQRFNWH